MNNLNSLILEGNLVSQAEIREPKKGFKVCTMNLAVDRSYKKSDGNFYNEVSYFDVVAYNHMAEICCKLGEKGRGLRVVGRLKQERWTDENKKTHSSVSVIAEHIEFKPKFNTTKTEDKNAADQAGKSGAAAATAANGSSDKSPVNTEAAEEQQQPVVVNADGTFDPAQECAAEAEAENQAGVVNF